MAALLAARAVYAARDEALRIARAPLNFHHILGRKPNFLTEPPGLKRLREETEKVQFKNIFPR